MYAARTFARAVRRTVPHHQRSHWSLTTRHLSTSSTTSTTSNTNIVKNKVNTVDNKQSAVTQSSESNVKSSEESESSGTGIEEAMFDEESKRLSQSDAQRFINRKLRAATKGVQLLELLTAAEDLGWRSNYLTYQKAVQRCVVLNDLKSAEFIVERAIARGMTIDTTLYNELLFAYADLGDTEMLRRTRKKMLESGAIFDVSSFKATIFGCVVAGKDKKAFEFLEEMEASGLVVDVSAWNCLLEGHRKRADSSSLKGILKVVQAMKKAGVALNSTSYRHWIHVNIKARYFDKALQLLIDMRQNDVPRELELVGELMSAMADHPTSTDPATMGKVLDFFDEEVKFQQK